MKSASAPPRGGAREPKQTQRRAYGCAAPALQRGGIVKIFHWEGEPQRKTQHSHYVFTYTSSTLESRHLPTAATPFLCGITIYRTAPTRSQTVYTSQAEGLRRASYPNRPLLPLYLNPPSIF
ncbi:uncharacterized protein K441DRAFT_102327 [Cenococcum geophilum 1.58]|uniref:uncharacterized protein n=1 Tax=Cenococcum geophilum 1.58 TaxID=794803 RepID=UPI0035901DAC|nr:hypothetical protein K441DRAFT_102327 [Cenococcum geophilum 1.58]